MDAKAAKVNAVRVQRAVDVLKRGVEFGAMPGAVVCAYRNGSLFLHEAIGTTNGETPARTSTLYDLASLTKPLATASSVLALAEEGRLLLGAPLGEFFGDASASLPGVTVRHLLTHTSGLPAWTPCYDSGYGLDNAVAAILRLTPTAPPGERYEYSCLGFILLARIVGMVTGYHQDRVARDRVFAPLGLSSLRFAPPHDTPDLRAGIAPTIPREGPGKDETLTGVVHDGNARGIGMGGNANGASDVSGNAGLFGCAHDVAAWGEAVLRGLPSQAPLWGAPTRARMLESQIPADVGGHTLAFFAHPNGLAPVGDLLSDRAVGHSGYTGTVLTIDPAYDLTVAVLTNAVYGDGKADWLKVRRRFLNALASALL